MSESDPIEPILRHLASMPGEAHTTVSRATVRKIMLRTGGDMILRGRLYEIRAKPVGAGIYRLTTVATEPARCRDA